MRIRADLLPRRRRRAALIDVFYVARAHLQERALDQHS